MAPLSVSLEADSVLGRSAAYSHLLRLYLLLAASCSAPDTVLVAVAHDSSPHHKNALQARRMNPSFRVPGTESWHIDYTGFLERWPKHHRGVSSIRYVER